ncbi:hypothetical protein TNCV_2436101 [Trichonephila clavipes]|nr:hypothetical protein TNCV_2436101 [Trichonephila clavipes]
MNKILKTPATQVHHRKNSLQYMMIMYVKPQLYGRQRHFEVCSKLKYIIDAYSNVKNEMNNVAPVPTSSEMRNIMESMLSSLDAHSDDEMNCKVGDIE